VTTSLCFAVTLALLAFLSHTIRTNAPTLYRILHLEGTLRIEPIDDYRKYHYERRQTIQATSDDLRLIEFREHWSGKGSRNSLSIECIKPVDAILLDGRVAEEDGRVHRWLYPTRPLARGECISLEVHQTHIDDVETQRPYFRQGGGRFATERIRVEVHFPIGYEPHEIHGGVWNTGRPLLQTQVVRNIDYIRTEDRVAGFAAYAVEVSRTQPHHSYGLYWTWPAGGQHRAATTPHQRPASAP
jgi:hypothetical protein